MWFFSLLTTCLPLCIPQQYTLFNGPKCKNVLLMQISFKNFKVLGESPGNDWEKWEKSKTKTNLYFLLHFYVNMTPVRKHVLSFKHVLCIFLYFVCQVKIRPQKKRDSNITLVNRRPMGKSYIYIYIYLMMLVKASILWSSLWLDFDLTPGQAFADQLH